MSKRLIYCAFASKEGFKGSENLSGQADSLRIYLQNASVCCFTAKKHNPDCDVAFVHNLKTIPEEFLLFFKQHSILSIYVEYNDFLFPADYKWSLAFYKLCALQYFAYESPYESVVSLDVDTYSIGSLAPCFSVMDDRLVLYNVQHSNDLDAYQRRLKEYWQLYEGKALPTVYGGEFIAGKKEYLQKFGINYTGQNLSDIQVNLLKSNNIIPLMFQSTSVAYSKRLSNVTFEHGNGCIDFAFIIKSDD